MPPPDETVPSSQGSNFDMFKEDDIDLEDMMAAECSHITQEMRKHIMSPFSDSQTQYEKDLLVAAVLASQEAILFSALIEADTSSYDITSGHDREAPFAWGGKGKKKKRRNMLLKD